MYIHPDLAVYATDRFVLVCFALFVEAIIGRMSWVFRVLPHPYDGLFRLARFLGNRLNKSRRGRRALIVRGAIVTLFLCGVAVSIGWWLSVWAVTFRAGWLVDLVLLSLLVSQRGSYGDASRTIRALTRDGVKEARAALAAYHRGYPERLDRHGICRSLTEHLAGELGRWLLGPVLWYLVFGLPGLLLYAAIIAAARGLAPDAETRAAFGWLAHRLETLAGAIPGWVAGNLVVLASFLSPTARPIRAWRTMYKHAKSIPSPAYAWPAAAFAGALSIELGGAHSVEGRRLQWFGDGSPRLTERDAHRALMLFGYTCVLHAALAAAFAVSSILWAG